jgi:ornithine cyclodeaminase/alanine dehydrogenase-like protein (mu-crystallin family)
MLTAFLSRTDVSRHLQALHLLQELREALTAKRKATSVGTLPFEANAEAASPTLVRQAALTGVPAWMVTVRAETGKGPRSMLQLHDAATGQLLAMMEAGHLMMLRASLLSALAADVLARPDAKNVAVLGAGAAASSALKALRLVRSIEFVWIHEKNVVDNFELSRKLQTTLSMAVAASDTAQEAVADADIVVLTGDVSLEGVTLKPGAHVSVLSAETFRRPPLSPEVLSAARRFVDASEPVLEWGLPFHAELGEVLSKKKPGRQSAEELTCFASIGPAALDLLAAWHVFEGARHDEGLTRIDLEA